MEQDGFSLDVTIPAAEMAQLRRRVAYLEAALIQVLRDGNRIKEWFSAAELADLHLPGMPTSRAAVTRQAKKEGWMARQVPGQRGAPHIYHFSSLPRRAFAALIDLVLKNPPPVPEPVTDVPALPAPTVPAQIDATNTAPSWMLPLMRVIRVDGAATVREALELLPRYLPAGVPCPTPDEAAEVLRRLGMVS